MRHLALGIALLTIGCGKEPCPEETESKLVTTGITDMDSLTYVSSPWDGPLVEFPGNGSVTFLHGLGVVPDLVSTYVSFSEHGTGQGNVSENTGNQGEIVCVDDKVVVVDNGTCAQFYIRVVAARLGETGEQSQEACVVP